MEFTLLQKVSLLITSGLLTSALGMYLGRRIDSLWALIPLIGVFIVGAFGVQYAAGISPAMGIAANLAWCLAAGLMMGPAVNVAEEVIGWQSVCAAFVGSAAVLAACGAFGMKSGVDFSPMGQYLMIGLWAIIIIGLIGLFWTMESWLHALVALVGMFIFAGFMVYDFFRLTQTENTWQAAVKLSVQLELDFWNFFLRLLEVLMYVAQYMPKK